MSEDSARTHESDPPKMTAGAITAFCKACNRMTPQNYLGLEFNSRKIASRCLECKNTNFREEDPERWRNRSKKAAKTPLDEIEEEKKKIFGEPAQSPACNGEGDVLEAESGKAIEY